MITSAGRIIAGLASLLALTMPAAAQPDTDPLAKIGHIV